MLWLLFATVLAGGAAAQEVSFSSGTYRVYEGDVLTPELVLSHARSEDVTVRVEALDLGSAESGTDFAADPWRVTVPAGKTRQSFDIATFDDDVREHDEEFLLHVSPYGHSPGLRRSSNGNQDAVAVITEYTGIWLSESAYRLREGGGVTITAWIDNPKSRAFTLDFTLSGAGGASDADVVGGFGTRSVTVPANGTKAQLWIGAVQDTVQGELGESVGIGLSTSEGGVVIGRREAVVHIVDDDTPAFAFWAPASRTGEGSGTHDVRVILEAAPDTDIAMPYTVGGTATGGSDFTIAGSGTVTVKAGSTTANIPVAIVDDSAPEGDETVVLTLVGRSHRWIGTDTHTLTIADNEPRVSFASASGSAAEGSGTQDVEVRLDPAPASGITLSYTVGGTATGGSDYAALSGTVTVKAGSKTANIPVAIVDDDMAEVGETVVLTLTGGSDYRVGSPDTHTLTIAASDQPVAYFALAWQEAGEGGGTRGVRLNLSEASTSDLTVNYTVGGSATPGADFTIANSGTLTVPAGAVTATVPVAIVDDGVEDRGETVVLTLDAGEGYHVGGADTHTLTIVDDDGVLPPSTPVVSFASASSHTREGVDTHWSSLSCGVEMNLWPAPDSELMIAYTSGGTAARGSEYPALPGVDYLIFRLNDQPRGTIRVAAGATKAWLWPCVEDDGEREDDETIVLTLAEGTGYTVGSRDTHVRTIADNDGVLPTTTTTASFASASSHANEGAGLEGSERVSWNEYGVITTENRVAVNLWPVPASDITLSYTVGGTATSGSDYRALSGTVEVPAGTKQAAIHLRVVADSAVEGGETVVLALTGGTGYTVGGHGTHTFTIADDEGGVLPAASFASYFSHANEGSGTHDVTVNLSPAPASGLTLPYTVGGTATGGSDYAALSGTLAVPAGATAATIPVSVLADAVPDSGETLVLTLAGGEGHEVGSPDTHTLIIVDTDTPTVSFASASEVAGEGSGTHEVTVELSPAPSSPVTLKYAVGGTATPGADFTIANSGTLTVPAGARTATIPVALVDDAVEDGGETVILRLAAGEGYRVGSADTHTLTINPVPTVTFARWFGVTFEGQRPASGVPVRLQLSLPPAEGITVHYTVGPDDTPLTGTPTPGLDYEALSGTVEVPAGAHEAFIPVTIIDDSVEDSGEVMRLTLADGPDYTVGSGGAHFDVYIFNHETDDLETLVQARLDAAVADGDGASGSLWRRALAAVRGEAPPDGLAPLTAAEAEALAAEHAGRGEVDLASLWAEIAGVIGDGATDPPPEPAVTIAAVASPVTEGGDATFTLTAAPAPASALSVTVTVAGDGDYGITAGERTVTIPTTGSAVLTLPTTGDDADEPDGSVTVTVKDGDGYTVGSAASGSVSIRDDDEAAPEVTIAAGASPITEGGDTVFTLTAVPAPAADLAVSVTVAATGDWGVTAGSRTVTIPTTGSAVLTLATTGDDVDEPDGSVGVTVTAGSGYTVGSAASGGVTVRDDDGPTTPDYTDYQTVVNYTSGGGLEPMGPFSGSDGGDTGRL